MKYFCIFLFMLCIIQACTGKINPAVEKTMAEKEDSTIIFERKLSNKNETYLVQAILHKNSDGEYKSFGVYKKDSKNSWINMFYLPDEYEDSVSFNVIGENSLSLSNATFTQNGTLLVSFIGRAHHTCVVVLAQNKSPEIFEVKQGCFLFDEQNDLLLWNNWNYTMNEDQPEGKGYAEMTYSLYEPGKAIKSISIKDGNKDYNDTITVCNEDNQFKTLKSKETTILQLISKYLKE